MFNKTNKWRRGAKRNASILLNETAIEKRVRALMRVREYTYTCFVCMCECMCVCVCVCVHANE